MLSKIDEAHPLFGLELRKAKTTIADLHYTRSVPSGKSVVFQYEAAIVMFSIPANKNIAGFLGFAEVWELTRLWAPDGHRRNLLTEAIAFAVRAFRKMFPEVDALVSYADPNVGHQGTVYRAASWCFAGSADETRSYKDSNGLVVARRAFHSGSKALRKDEIIARGYEQIKAKGKLRFVKPLTGKARRAWAKRTLASVKAQA